MVHFWNQFIDQLKKFIREIMINLYSQNGLNSNYLVQQLKFVSEFQMA